MTNVLFFSKQRIAVSFVVRRASFWFYATFTSDNEYIIYNNIQYIENEVKITYFKNDARHTTNLLSSKHQNTNTDTHRGMYHFSKNRHSLFIMQKTCDFHYFS